MSCSCYFCPLRFIILKYFLLVNVILKLIFEQMQPIPITMLYFKIAFDLLFFFFNPKSIIWIWLSLTKVFFVGLQDLDSCLEKGIVVRIRIFEIRYKLQFSRNFRTKGKTFDWVYRMFSQTSSSFR